VEEGRDLAVEKGDPPRHGQHNGTGGPAGHIPGHGLDWDPPRCAHRHKGRPDVINRGPPASSGHWHSSTAFLFTVRMALGYTHRDISTTISPFSPWE
jgi:hypothetical protein